MTHIKNIENYGNKIFILAKKKKMHFELWKMILDRQCYDNFYKISFTNSFIYNTKGRFSKSSDNQISVKRSIIEFLIVENCFC